MRSSQRSIPKLSEVIARHKTRRQSPNGRAKDRPNNDVHIGSTRSIPTVLVKCEALQEHPVAWPACRIRDLLQQRRDGFKIQKEGRPYRIPHSTRGLKTTSVSPNTRQTFGSRWTLLAIALDSNTVDTIPSPSPYLEAISVPQTAKSHSPPSNQAYTKASSCQAHS